MPPKKRPASDAFETLGDVHSGLFQLDKLCTRVSRHFAGANRSDLRTVDPVHATALADELDAVAKMFRAHAASYADATRLFEQHEHRATLDTLPGDALALIYDALGSDEQSKRAMRATCHGIRDDLAARRPYRRLRYAKQNQLRIFTGVMTRLSCITSIRELDISWLAAHRVHRDVGFELFTALERVRLYSVCATADWLKPITPKHLMRDGAPAPIEVDLDYWVDIELSLMQLQTLFRRRVIAVTGCTPANFQLHPAFPLRRLSLVAATTESLCNAAAYVTERVDYRYKFTPAASVIRPISQRPPEQRPVLHLHENDIRRYSYHELLKYYKEVEVDRIRPAPLADDPVRRWKEKAPSVPVPVEADTELYTSYW